MTTDDRQADLDSLTHVTIGHFTATRIEQFSAPGGLWSHVFPALTEVAPVAGGQP